MSYVALVADDLAQAGLDLLEEAGIEVVLSSGNPDLFRETLPRADVLLVRSATQVTAKVMADAPNLKMVGRAGAGIDNVDVKAATQRGIAVINAPGANTVSAAEHAIALLLSLFRRIPEASRAMAGGKWDRKRFGGTELRGKTLGVVGFGRVGSHLACISRAFGMNVLVYDPFISEARAEEQKVTLMGLDELLKNSDVVSLHMPLTKETTGLIGRRKLKIMKNTAVLVNTARGGLVDEAALVEAVEKGRIAGAALDVFSEEPLADDSPLRSTDHILVTPHLGASTIEAQARVSEEICRSARDVLLKGDVRGAVNITGVSASALGRLQPLLDLSSRVGHLAASIAGGPITDITVSYRGSDDDAPKPVMLSAVKGVLSSVGIGPVSIINAMALAEKRKISVDRRVGRASSGFDVRVGVSVTTKKGAASVVGALVGDRQGRIVDVDGYKVDFVPAGDVLVLRNTDVPGVIGQVGSVLGEVEINIASYHQARSADGNGALAAVVVDHEPDRKIINRLKKIDHVTDVQYVALGK